MLKTLLSALRAMNDKTSAAEAERLVGMARDELAAARRNLAEAEAAYQTSRLADDAKATLAARDDQLRKAVLVDRAEAALELAEQHYVEALARDAERVRVKRYEEARKLSEAAKADLARYPGLSQQIVEILTAVARADQAVAGANADLPAGVAPLQHPESAVRGLPSTPEKILGKRRVADIEVPDFARQEADPHGRLWLKKVGQVEIEVQPGLSALEPESLARSISLPGLRADDPALWRPAGHQRIMGALGADGGLVLAAAETLAAESPVDPRTLRFPEKRVVPVEQAGEVAL